MYSMCNDKTQMSTLNVSILRFFCGVYKDFSSGTSRIMVFFGGGLCMGILKALYLQYILPPLDINMLSRITDHFWRSGAQTQNYVIVTEGG